PPPPPPPPPQPVWDLRYSPDIWTYGPHHFLRLRASKTIYDLTFDQYAYYNLEIPYELGHIVNPLPDEMDTAIKFAKELGYDNFINATEYR
ncbi:MAG: hypothetical protein LBO08_01015, partial [Rickettsiales bacterium]|nr:hypothetical protein [Rickettsiales bacterium]